MLWLSDKITWLQQQHYNLETISYYQCEKPVIIFGMFPAARIGGAACRCRKAMERLAEPRKARFLSDEGKKPPEFSAKN